MNDIIIWSFIGMILMAIEVFGLQGLGVLFTGFSAITVAFMIYLNPALNDNIGSQLVYFFIFTAFWSAILWIPLNKFIRYSDTGDYKNIIGTYATTNTEMIKGTISEIIWSGTKTRAIMVADNPSETIPDKTSVKIIAVIDGVFHVTNDIRKENPEPEIKKIPKKKNIS